MLPIKLIGQAVSEEKIFEIVDGCQIDTGAWVYYKSPCEPNGSGELRSVVFHRVVQKAKHSQAHWWFQTLYMDFLKYVF